MLLIASYCFLLLRIASDCFGLLRIASDCFFSEAAGLAGQGDDDDDELID